jgi:4-oxalocrotonate tautomerase
MLATTLSLEGWLKFYAERGTLAMPIIRIELIEGRAPELKEELIRRVTEAVTTTLAVQPAQVRVLLYELPPAHWAVGGVSKAAQGVQTEEQDDKMTR